jgi:nucleoside-diphosphate-sugar epimerase
VIAYQQVFALDYTIIRPSALYGPGCVSRRVSQIFIESALVGSKLRVDGDGDERLDFSYVADVVDGTVRAIAAPEARNEVFNITAGQSRSLSDLIALIQEHFPEVEVEFVERDALRPYRGTLSIDKARRLIGYDPATTLEDGLDRYVAWYRELTAGGVLSRT